MAGIFRRGAATRRQCVYRFCLVSFSRNFTSCAFWLIYRNALCQILSGSVEPHDSLSTPLCTECPLAARQYRCRAGTLRLQMRYPHFGNCENLLQGRDSKVPLCERINTASTAGEQGWGCMVDVVTSVLCTDPQPVGKPRSQGRSHQRIPGFKLRETQTSGARPPDLVQLEEIFGAAVQRRIIGRVYDQLQPDMAACVDALVNISDQSSQAETDAATCSAQVDDMPFPGLHGENCQLSTPQGNVWDTLPPDCHVLITNKLSIKDLAVASLVCTSMARSAALVLGRVDAVRCRCSIRSIAGMLRCHRNASKVCRDLIGS